MIRSTLKVTTLLLLLLVIFESCSSPKSKVINKSSIHEDVVKLKKSLSKETSDSNKIEILDRLLSYSKDLEYFKTRLREEMTNDISLDIEKYLVSGETFKTMTDKLFNSFVENKYTYRQLFSELDSYSDLEEENYKELIPIYKQIDSICLYYQNKIDETLTESGKIKDTLNKIVGFELVSIRETEIDYSDVVAVQIKMTNKTESPIEAISFELVLTDKLGNKLATLNCKSNDRFIQSDVGTWTYGKYDINDIYKNLENINASHVSAKFRVKKINVDGNLIGSDVDNLDLGEHFQYLTNMEYKTPSIKLFGYCPYLKSENPYSKKALEIKERLEQEIENGKFPILKLINDINPFEFKL